MDFKQLEAFAKVVELGSFSRAAEKLHLTQPTISAHVGSLESELGTQLIVRTPRMAYPSETGKLLYEYTCDMLALRDNAIALCTRHKNDQSGTLLIAASTIPYQYLLPSAMASFREDYPEVNFQLTRCDSAAVISAVQAGRAELGLTGTRTPDAKLVYQEICEDELVVIAPAIPPYTERGEEPFGLQELLKTPFVVREAGSGTRRETEEYMQGKGVDPSRLRVVAQMDNPDAVKSAVTQGLGISVVSRLSAEDYGRMGLLKVFQLEEEPLARKLYFVYHKHRSLSPLAKKFQQYLLEGKNVV